MRFEALSYYEVVNSWLEAKKNSCNGQMVQELRPNSTSALSKRIVEIIFKLTSNCFSSILLIFGHLNYFDTKVMIASPKNFY